MATNKQAQAYCKRISQLESRVAELERKRDEYKNQADGYYREAAKAYVELKRLREVEKAAQNAINAQDKWKTNNASLDWFWTKVRELRAALGRSNEK